MPNSRSLTFVALAVALLGLGVWLVTGSGPGNSDPATEREAAEARAAAASLQAEAGADAEDPTASVANPEVQRQAVTAPPEVDAKIGITGQVLDPSGNPVAKAKIACSATPDFGFDPDSFDPDEVDFETMFRSNRSPSVETTTDAQGKFRVGAPGSGRNVQVRVQARAHLVLDRRVPRPTEHDVDLGALTLQPGAVVSGRVLDGAGRAVVDARVSRRGERGQGGDIEFQFFGSDFADNFGGGDGERTDAEGRFELEHAAPGNFALVARHEEHPPARLDGLSVAPGGVLTDVVVTVEPGTSIRGKLVDVPKGTERLRVLASKPRGNDTRAGFIAMIGGAGEMIDNLGPSERSADVAADGTFALRGLAVGQTYRVWATQRGRGFTGNATCSEQREVMSGVQDLELRYEAGVTVTFTVVDAGTDATLDKLWVSNRLVGSTTEGFDFMAFAPTFTRERPYPDGRVTIANLRPKKKQTLTLAVEALGFAKEERKGIELPLVGTIDLGTLRLEPTPIVKVQVRSSVDGAPVAGATVQIRERRDPDARRAMEFAMQGSGSSPQSAKTDADGRAVVNGKASTKVAVTVKSKDFAPYESEDITLSERGGEHEARLLVGGTAEVTVVDAEGKTVAEANVERKGPGDSSASERTDADGVARFAHLTPGKHRFKLSGRGNPIQMGGGNFRMSMQVGGDEAAAEPDGEEMDIVDQALATLRLTKSAMASLSGLVRENGVPLAGAQVSFMKGAGDDEGDAATRQIMQATFGQLAGGRRGSSRGRTDDMGRYELDDLATGEHRLRITHSERAMPTTVRISLRAGKNVYDVALATTILRGTVLDHTGKPVADAKISVTASTGADGAASQALAVLGGIPELAAFGGRRDRNQVTTDAQGRYELRGVQDGQELVVRAEAKGFAAAVSKPVRPAAGTTTESVDVQLVDAGSVRVRATTQAPFATVQATCTSAQGVAPVMRMLRRGEATLEGLQAGTWRIALTVPGGEAPEPRTVEVAPGKVIDVSF